MIYLKVMGTLRHLSVVGPEPASGGMRRTVGSVNLCFVFAMIVEATFVWHDRILGQARNGDEFDLMGKAAGRIGVIFTGS